MRSSVPVEGVKAADTVTCVGRESVEVVMCMKPQDRI